jgi:hypothetical protein
MVKRSSPPESAVIMSRGLGYAGRRGVRLAVGMLIGQSVPLREQPTAGDGGPEWEAGALSGLWRWRPTRRRAGRRGRGPARAAPVSSAQGVHIP